MLVPVLDPGIRKLQAALPASGSTPVNRPRGKIREMFILYQEGRTHSFGVGS